MNAQHLTGDTDKPRSKQDFYRTPAWATEALLDVETFEGSISEPACGDGAISRLLEQRYGTCAVTSKDVEDWGYGERQDFLTDDTIYDNIVTNPPYCLAKEFVQHGLACARSKVALLLKLNFLEGQERAKWLPHTPLATVYVFSRRLSFDRSGETGLGKGLLAYAWFVWDKTHKGSPQIKWLASSTKKV